MFDLFTSRETYGSTLRVRVTPKSSSDRINVVMQPDGTRLIRVYVTVVAENGKANQRVLALLAKELGIPKSTLRITHGTTSRDKIIIIDD